MELKATKQERSLHNRWEQLSSVGDKTTILNNCEKYASWTLPYLFPEDNLSKSVELPIEIDSIGAQGVNHLSNRIISTLFPARSLFFRLRIDQEMRDLIEAAMMEASGGQASQETLKAQLETQLAEAQKVLTKAENRAQDRLKMVQYRPQAIHAMKLLIVTGNALIFHPEDDTPIQVYSIRNYSIVRDCSGTPVEIMTRETRAYATFNKEVQDALKNDDAFKRLQQHSTDGHNHSKGYHDDTEVTIYTQILLEDDGKYHVRQHADDVPLPTRATYTKSKLRWIPLTWNLIQGEDYGRGLVGDFGGAFHALSVLNSALLNTAAIMGDIKFLVDPASLVDVERMQNSPSGSYHVGKPTDVGTPQLNLAQNYQILEGGIARYEKQIAQAFMLTQQLTRQAERVTATEITRDVDELEASNAGIYSQYAAGWQHQTAGILLDDIDFDGVGDGIEPDVITGMDNLSRAGEAQNMRLFLTDVAMLNTVPEDVRRGIKVNRFLGKMGDLHKVDYESWVMTDDELAAAQQAENVAAMQQQQAAIEGQGQVEAQKAAAQQM